MMTETTDSMLLTILAEAQRSYLNIPQHSLADDVPEFTRYDHQINATSGYVFEHVSGPMRNLGWLSTLNPFF